MALLFITASYLMATASAYNCDICLKDWCNEKNIIIRNINITDQMAIDRKNNILYVQTNYLVNMAVYLDQNSIQKTRIVQKMETSGLTVNTRTGELITSGFKNTLYKIKHGINSTVNAFPHLLDGRVDKLFYEGMIYLTLKDKTGLYLINNDEIPGFVIGLSNYTITDFVKNKYGIVFVANNVVYEFKDPFNKDPEMIFDRHAVLSIDKYEDVYLAVISEKLIYKQDRDRNCLVVHAVYNDGFVSRFTFDKFNNIIVYDVNCKSLAYWKTKYIKCKTVKL